MQRKRPSRTPRRNTGSTRRSGRSGRPAWLKAFFATLLLLCIAAGAWWYFQGRQSTAPDDTKLQHIDTVREKGNDADYTDAATEIQDAVTAWLKAQDADVKEIDTQKREEPRRSTGGKILWTTKQLEVTPKEAFSRESMEKELAKSQGKAVLYQVTGKTLDGQAVTEYDIALFDMLDKEQVYLVTVRLYVTAPGAAPSLAQKIKKAVGKVSGQSPPAEEKKEGNASTAPAEVKGRLAIVIDDCGSNMSVLQDLNNIPVPLTYAVMPYKSHTADSANSGYGAGRQIFVHMPMQPQGTASSEAVYIGTDMSDSKIKATANEILDQVPHAIGMNNHQGSLATSDQRVMSDIMQVMRSRGLAYLDSRTISSSVGEQTARSNGVETSRNNLFIDNDASVEAVKSRLRQAAHIAQSNGSAIVIGHCRANTAQAISEMVDELHNEGIDLVFATSLME